MSKYARVQRCVHNDLKREWLCVIDNALQILLWQTPKYGVAYSYSHVLLCVVFAVPVALCLSSAWVAFGCNAHNLGAVEVEIFVGNLIL